MFGRLAMGFAHVRAGTRVLMLVLVQARGDGVHPGGVVALRDQPRHHHRHHAELRGPAQLPRGK